MPDVNTVGNFGSKSLSYFLLPLYTSYLTTVEYGTYDLLSTTISLLIPILTVNMAASIMRFSLDRDADLQAIITTGIYTITKGLILFFGVIIINRFLDIFSFVNQYIIYFAVLYILTIALQVLCSIAKGLEDVTGMAVNGVIHTLLLLIFNILFLIKLNYKLDGYFLANILSLGLASIYLVVRIRVWKYISIKSISRITEKKMTRYGGPLIVTSIGWWINNVSDRYIVTWICGVGANGVYSVAYKIPSILMTFQSIFNQAWQISTVGEYNKNDANGFFSNIYNVFNMLNILFCSFLIILCKKIAEILFANEFFSAWEYVPFLMISVVFGSLIGVIDGIFQAVKDSKIQSKSVALGAILNIFLNIILVFYLGPIGAAVSTAIAYVVTWAVSIINVRKYIDLKINLRKHVFSYSVLWLQAIAFVSISESIIFYIIQILFIIILILVYIKEINNILGILIKKHLIRL